MQMPAWTLRFDDLVELRPTSVGKVLAGRGLLLWYRVDIETYWQAGFSGELDAQTLFLRRAEPWDRGVLGSKCWSFDTLFGLDAVTRRIARITSRCIS